MSATLQVKPAEPLLNEKAVVPEADTVAAAAAVDPPAGSETGKSMVYHASLLQDATCARRWKAAYAGPLFTAQICTEGSVHMYLLVI